MKKLLLVDNLTSYNLFFLLLYRLFGFRIIYLNSFFLKNKESLIYILEGLDIKSIDYSTLNSYDFELSFNLPYQLAIEVHNRLINEQDYQNLNTLLNIKIQKKAEIALIDIIRKYIGAFPNLLIIADYYSSQYQVFLWHKRNFVINKIESKYKNLNNFIISFIELLFSLFNKLFKLTIFKIKNSLKKDIKLIIKNETKKTTTSTVIYFPHKGLKTANSYEKNFFYSKDINSPLYPKNIEHIEYGLLQNTKEYKNIEEDYAKKKLNYRFIPRVNIKAMIAIAIQFIKITRKIPLSSKDILILSLFINIKYYLKYLESSSNAKIAIVGYDYLFPKSLSLALDILNIHTVAYQERYLSAFVGLGSVSVDTYFMWNSALKKRIDKSELSFVGDAIFVGCVKIDLFNTKSDKRLIDIKQKYKKVIVAFDWHSASNKFDNQKIAVANWKNNLIFYRDLIKLAITFPEIYIIIRGKDDAWCDMEIFEDIYNIMNSINNIEVNREFDRLNVSYQLVKDADLVIGKYTSIMEEALAYGIPAISCDYGYNFSGNIQKMYNGDSCFKFVSCYDELQDTIIDTLQDKDIVNFECIDLLYKTVDNPKEMILNKIENILENKCH